MEVMKGKVRAANSYHQESVGFSYCIYLSNLGQSTDCQHLLWKLFYRIAVLKDTLDVNSGSHVWNQSALFCPNTCSFSSSRLPSDGFAVENAKLLPLLHFSSFVIVMRLVFLAEYIFPQALLLCPVVSKGKVRGLIHHRAHSLTIIVSSWNSNANKVCFWKLVLSVYPWTASVPQVFFLFFVLIQVMLFHDVWVFLQT